MAEQPINIVFFPHSVDYGLAGTNRLQNIIYFIEKDRTWSMCNIALQDKKRLLTNEPGPLLANTKNIYYGPSILNFITHIFLTAAYLVKYKAYGKNIIYFYGEVDLKNFFFVTWARLIGYKIVIDIVEDLETVSRFSSFKNKIKYRSAVFFRKHLQHFADGFTVVSTQLQTKIIKNYPLIPLFFLPVTVNKHLLAESKSRQSRLFTIFYSGSFNEKDGLPYLLNALSMLKQEGENFKLILSGGGAPKEMEKFWMDVIKYKVEKNVDYRGMLSRENYITVLSGEVDVLCMTRINSAFANAGFPFKLGEFLSTGKPVIASKVGDIDKYLTDDDAFLVEPENPVEIKQALSAIIANRQLAHEIGERGKIAAMKYFDHELYSASLENFLETVIWQ